MYDDAIYTDSVSMSNYISLEQTRDDGLIFTQCWDNVGDVGTALRNCWPAISCFLSDIQISWRKTDRKHEAAMRVRSMDDKPLPPSELNVVEWLQKLENNAN